uniref:Uncharacterized protein n=1 Tax=Pygocentrus nattereri TaxID=42514 RepID=A0A3B4EGA9_PYGNA
VSSCTINHFTSNHSVYISTMDLQDVVLVNLSSLLLKSLDQLGCCKALKICILADNFLTRIDPLVECVRLVKLDLKGNQVGLYENNICNQKILTFIQIINQIQANYCPILIIQKWIRGHLTRRNCSPSVSLILCYPVLQCSGPPWTLTEQVHVYKGVTLSQFKDNLFLFFCLAESGGERNHSQKDV